MKKRLKKKLAKKQFDLLVDTFFARSYYGDWSDEYFEALSKVQRFEKKYRRNSKNKPHFDNL